MYTCICNPITLPAKASTWVPQVDIHPLAGLARNFLLIHFFRPSDKLRSMPQRTHRPIEAPVKPAIAGITALLASQYLQLRLPLER